MNIRIVLLTVVIAGAAAFFLFHHERESSVEHGEQKPPIATSTSPQTVVSTSEKPKSASEPEKAKPIVPSSSFANQSLPPPDTPLKSIAENLNAQALAGNSRAACRLSYELHRCHQLATHKNIMDALRKQLTTLKSDTPEKANALKDYQDEKSLVERDTKVCDGLAKSGLLPPWQYLLIAAQGGHVPSMIRFASTPPIDEENFARDLEGWGAYKQNAIPMLEKAFEAGNSTAATQLAWFYSGFPVAGGVVVEKDPIQAIKYTQVAIRMSDAKSRADLERRLARISAGVSPADVLAAKSSGDDLYLKKFPGQNNVNTTSPLHKDGAEECLD